MLGLILYIGLGRTASACDEIDVIEVSLTIFSANASSAPGALTITYRLERALSKRPNQVIIKEHVERTRLYEYSSKCHELGSQRMHLLSTDNKQTPYPYKPAPLPRRLTYASPELSRLLQSLLHTTYSTLG